MSAIEHTIAKEASRRAKLQLDEWARKAIESLPFCVDADHSAAQKAIEDIAIQFQLPLADKLRDEAISRVSMSAFSSFSSTGAIRVEGPSFSIATNGLQVAATR